AVLVGDRHRAGEDGDVEAGGERRDAGERRFALFGHPGDLFGELQAGGREAEPVLAHIFGHDEDARAGRGRLRRLRLDGRGPGIDAVQRPRQVGRPECHRDPVHRPSVRSEKKGRPQGLPGTPQEIRAVSYFKSAVQILLYMSFTSFGQGGTNSALGALSGTWISGALAKAGSMNLWLPMMPLS